MIGKLNKMNEKLEKFVTKIQIFTQLMFLWQFCMTLNEVQCISNVFHAQTTFFLSPYFTYSQEPLLS